MDAIGVGHEQGVLDSDAGNGDIFTGVEVDCPAWCIGDGDVAEEDVFTVEQPDDAARSCVINIRAILCAEFFVHVVLSLSGVFGVEVGRLPIGIVSHCCGIHE